MWEWMCWLCRQALVTDKHSTHCFQSESKTDGWLLLFMSLMIDICVLIHVAVANIFCTSCYWCWHCYQFDVNKAMVFKCVCYQKCIKFSASCQYHLLLLSLLLVFFFSLLLSLLLLLSLNDGQCHWRISCFVLFTLCCAYFLLTQINSLLLGHTVTRPRSCCPFHFVCWFLFTCLMLTCLMCLENAMVIVCMSASPAI